MTGKGPADGGRTGTVRNPARYCAAKSKQSGVRCKRYALVGIHLCDFHGGKNPEMRIKQQDALLELAMKRLGLTPEGLAAYLAEHELGPDAAALLTGRRALDGTGGSPG